VSKTEPWLVAHNLILSHAYAVEIYRNEFKPKSKGGLIGITLNGDWAEPFDSEPESESTLRYHYPLYRPVYLLIHLPDIAATQAKMDVAIGWYADPIYLGSYPTFMKKMLGDRLPQFTEEEIKVVKGSSDVRSFAVIPL
jgi:beta-glucosidase